MDFTDEQLTNTVKQFQKYLPKKLAMKVAKGVVDFSIDYATINETPYLLENIFDTNVYELSQLFEKSDFLKNKITNKDFDPTQLCYMDKEIIDPDTYDDIIKKKELIEIRKLHNSTTDAYTCKKCKNSKCTVQERQTRSGDEPATTYITCVECGYTFTL